MMDSPFSAILEGFLLALIACYKGGIIVGLIISDTDWSKITGPHGVAFLAVIAVIVLWGNGLRRERNEELRRSNEEIRREKRHAETIAMQRENSDKLIALTAKSIKAQAHVTASIDHLARELNSRPCAINQMRRDAIMDAIHEQEEE